jgi:dienelactone hydrolase
MWRILLVSMVGAGWLWGQADPLLAWMDRIAQAQLTAREAAVSAVTGRAGAERRRAVVREKFLASIGGLPEYADPLQARTTRTLAADGYSIEMVLFESLPGVWVTGNVYRPNGGGRHAGVLMPIGHTQEGKPEGQLLAANLALQGYVVLAYDPIGQGEREQTYLPQIGRALSGGGGNEHLELGARSLLIGQSVARYFIQDARRGLDYLASRADVDAERLGVVGCSGGGCITTYLAALDPRVKAAAPACYIQTFRKLFPGPTPDSEMALPQFLANGLDVADFVEMAAPLPWLLLATTEDYFTPEWARPVYEEARRWYGLYGAAERVQFHVGTGPHGTPRDSREAIYAFLAKWLRGTAGADRPVKLYTSRELRVTRTGNVEELAGSRKVWEVIAEEYRARRAPKPVAELQAELRWRGLGQRGAAPAVRVVGETRGAGYRVQEIRFESEPGIELAAKLYLPEGAGRRPGVVVVEEKRLRVPLYVQPSQSTAAVAEGLAKAGAVVLELEPRDSPGAYEGRPFLGNWVTNERADLIGRSLPVMRAQDIGRGVDLLAGRAEVDPGRIRGYARGAKGFWMLLAAALDERLGRMWLDRMPVSWEAALTAPLAGFLFDGMIPGLGRHWELRDFVAEGRLLRTDPANWMNQVVEAGAGARYRYVGQADEEFVRELLR